MGGGSESGVILMFFFGLLIFLIAREFFCWYCKFNQMVKLLEDIKERLEDPRTRAQINRNV